MSKGEKGEKEDITNKNYESRTKEVTINIREEK